MKNDAQGLVAAFGGPDPAVKPWLSVAEALAWVAFGGDPPPDDAIDRDNHLLAAERKLVRAAADGRVTARGAAGDRKRANRGAAIDDIPAGAFATPGAGLSFLDDALGLKLKPPMNKIVGADAYAGPYFYSVAFQTREVLRVFPPTELPGFVTLTQAVEWIMFRNPGALRPGDQDAPPVSMLRLQLLRDLDAAHGRHPGPTVIEAQDALLAALRAGRAAAIRLGRDGTATERMSPAEWIGIEIAEDTKNQHRLMLRATPEAGGGALPGALPLIATDGLLRAFKENPDWLSLPPAPAATVNGDFMTAAEALDWIAYRGAAAPENPSEIIERQRDANHQLIDALANQHLEASGRRGAWGRREMAGEHSAISWRFFLHPNRTITRDGWAKMDDHLTGAEWAEWRAADAPDWGDLRFKRVDVMDVWNPLKRSPAGPVSQAQCNKWVLEQFTNAAKAGGKLSRDEAFARNNALDRPYADASMRAAMRNIPSDLRLRRGEKKSGR